MRWIELISWPEILTLLQDLCSTTKENRDNQIFLYSTCAEKFRSRQEKNLKRGLSHNKNGGRNEEKKR